MRFLFGAILFLLLFSACKKYEKTNELESAVTTLSASNISYSSATIEGNIDTGSGDPVIEKGFCWSSLPNPTLVIVLHKFSLKVYLKKFTYQRFQNLQHQLD